MGMVVFLCDCPVLWINVFSAATLVLMLVGSAKNPCGGVFNFLGPLPLFKSFKLLTSGSLHTSLLLPHQHMLGSESLFIGSETAYASSDLLYVILCKGQLFC